MSSAATKENLLWTTLGTALESGRGGEPALLAGSRTFSYEAVAAAAVAGAAEIAERFPSGARLLIAARDQLEVALALLAALAAGATPVLADPTSRERLIALAREWKMLGFIGDAELGATLDLPALPPGAIGRWLAPAARLRDFMPRAVTPETPAFWTFTSGSTGAPKAVVHAHRGPRAAYQAFGRSVLRLGPEDVTIATGGLPFVYVLGNNFFFPLMAGAAAVLPADLLLPTVLGELRRHGATVLVAGPWSLAAIVRFARRAEWQASLRNLRLVLSAGEPLPARLFIEWRRRLGRELIDNLGCTEMFNSFVSSFPGAARAGSLGRVVPGFEVEVAGQPPAPGARGDLRVRGGSRAVAVGQEGRLGPPPGEWCDTGDEVEVDAEGGIVFLGRRDDRFKVKGRFIHPVEIERCLIEVDGVREVLAGSDVDEHGLTIVVASVVGDGVVDAAELERRCRERARARLEGFMTPSRIRAVEALPRNTRGKLERRVHFTRGPNQ